MIKIQHQNMPNVLNDDLIGIQWFSRFDSTMQSLDVHDYQRKKQAFLEADFLTLIFSTEIKVAKYGIESLDDIKDRISETWIVEEELESMLNEIKSKDEMIRKLESICGRIANLNEKRYKEVNEIISGWLKFAEFETVVLGEYDSVNNTIILYTKAIENYAKNNHMLLEQAYEEIFIHELLHACHYFMSESYYPHDRFCDILKRYDYTSAVVKESLAVYFEMKYCSLNGISNNIQEMFDFNTPEIYPYAGAEYIEDYHFDLIFHISCDDFDRAMRQMFRRKEEIFYNIKNNRYIKCLKPVVTPNSVIQDLFKLFKQL